MDNSSEANLTPQSDAVLCSARRAALSCLRLVIAIQCLGITGRYLWSELESESHVFEFLMFDLGLPERVAQLTDDIGAYACLAAGILFVVNLFRWPRCYADSTKPDPHPSRKSSSVLNWLEISAAALVAVWCIADALAHSVRGGLYSELAIGEVAVRFACPIALVLLILEASRSLKSLAWTARWILTIAVSMTFLVHGYKAIQLYGPFCDLILLSDMRVFQLDLSQANVETALLVIGWIDVMLALALLFTRYKSIAFYMLVWGLITSLSRTTAFGWSAWPETSIRAANWGAVLVLMIMWRADKR